jgi:hypothetical protein
VADLQQVFQTRIISSNWIVLAGRPVPDAAAQPPVFAMSISKKAGRRASYAWDRARRTALADEAAFPKTPGKADKMRLPVLRSNEPAISGSLATRTKT